MMNLSIKLFFSENNRTQSNSKGWEDNLYSVIKLAASAAPYFLRFSLKQLVDDRDLSCWVDKTQHDKSVFTDFFFNYRYCINLYVSINVHQRAPFPHCFYFNIFASLCLKHIYSYVRDVHVFCCFLNLSARCCLLKLKVITSIDLVDYYFTHVWCYLSVRGWQVESRILLKEGGGDMSVSGFVNEWSWLLKGLRAPKACNPA